MSEITANAYNPEPNPLLIVISGPSGVGKDVVLKRMEARKYPFHFVVTTTDRSPRPGEVDGVDYCFVSTEEFERMIRDGELLEYATVYGQYKGVSMTQVQRALASGHDVIMRLDVQGAATIRRMAPEAVLIFLACESEEALRTRLRDRKSDSEEALRTRLAIASKEMERLPEFDYLVVNRTDQLDEAVDGIVCIINAVRRQVRQRRISL